MKINICWSLLLLGVVWANTVNPGMLMAITVGLLSGFIISFAKRLVPIYIQIDKTGIKIIDESY